MKQRRKKSDEIESNSSLYVYLVLEVVIVNGKHTGACLFSQRQKLLLYSDS